MLGEKELNEITTRLDKIVALLEMSLKSPTLLNKIINGIALGISILGILAIIDIIRIWIGG